MEQGFLFIITELGIIIILIVIGIVLLVREKS